MPTPGSTHAAARSSASASAAPSNPRPIQYTSMTKEQFQSDAGVSFHNQQMSQIVTTMNAILGSGGPTILPSGVDVRGAKVTGLAAPTGPSDAVSAGHAEANYSPAATGPSLDIGGSNTLKGLAAVYKAVQPGTNISTTMPLAKLTGGGSAGSMVIQNGIVTSFKAPS